MFRDTFAVLALQKGATLEDVQTALGHKSIKITERSYGHWSRAREDRMHDVFSKTWDVVPIDSKRRAG
jgi:integrase